MLRFNSDYQEGAHPRILERLTQTNMVQTNGYGEDEYCEHAAALIKKRCGREDIDVHFLVGGTQANFTLLSAALRTYQGVLSAVTGHISAHETGAVESCGHEVLTLPETNGKITASQVDEACRLHFTDEAHEHLTMPKAVYLSFPTELGTIYSKEELTQMRRVCDRWKLYLYIDGARLGYGMAAEGNDVDLPFLAKTADAFYIGGTKQGALFGEAMVLVNDELKRDFRYVIKQKGGMLAKGRLLGVQFGALFEDDLYFELSRHAVSLAMRLKRAFEELEIPFLVDSPTNQQFPILSDRALDLLRDKYTFSYQKRIDDTHSAVRFCTSWATPEENVDQLIASVRAAVKA